MPTITGRLRTPALAAAPASPVAGEMYYDTSSNQLKVWNGTSWVPTAPSYATTLPASPVDGQEAILVDSITNPTYQWRFRYNAGSTSAYKWEFVGGTPAYVAVETGETTSTGTYVALTTAGPSFTCVHGGDYQVEIEAEMSNNGAIDGAAMSFDIGATGAVDANALFYYAAPANLNVSFGGKVSRLTSLAASTTLTAKYRVITGGTATFTYRRMLVTPIRVS